MKPKHLLTLAMTLLLSLTMSISAFAENGAPIAENLTLQT